MPKTLISTHTVPGDYSGSTTTVDITSGINDTYDSYEFHLIDLHPQTNSVAISFQVNCATGNTSGFNNYMPTAFIKGKRHESGTDRESHSYVAAYDQAQTQLYQLLCNDVGNDGDQAVSGVLPLYGPSSTEFHKHFISKMYEAHESDIHMYSICTGYINAVEAVDEISFKFDSGNIDSGVIKMYGVA